MLRTDRGPMFAVPVAKHEAVASPAAARAAKPAVAEPARVANAARDTDDQRDAPRRAPSWSLGTIAVSAPDPPDPPDAGSSLLRESLRRSAVSQSVPETGARIHTDLAAESSVKAVGAVAVTFGRDVYFGRGTYAPQTSEGAALLRHELAHVAQAQTDLRDAAAATLEIAGEDHPAEREAARIAAHGGRASYRTDRPIVFRQITTPVARKTADEIFLGQPPAVPPMNLEGFQTYTRVQADWFVEPTLQAGNARDDLWRLRLLCEEGPHIIAGAGDMLVSELRTVSAVDLDALRAFCRGTQSSSHTVRIFKPYPAALAARIERGRTLAELETIITGAVLELIVSDTQLAQLESQNLLPELRPYITQYQPNLERTFTPAPGAAGPEFADVIAFLTAIGPGGLAPLSILHGATPDERWVRNLHRFPLPVLQKLVANLADTTGTKRLVLILHSGHDEVGAFRTSAGLFTDLVVSSPNNLVLMIEGATSLAAITARIPSIASTWGQTVHRVRRISQVVIAGHGSPRSVQIAGTGPPTVHAAQVSYPTDDLDLDGNQAATQALLDALLRHMPPAAARIIYVGCLVAATHVARNTAAADIPAAVSGQQSLASFTQARARVAGVRARVQAARASVAAGDVTSFYDPAGNVQMTLPSDPNAFGSANAYARSGQEAEGVLRAAVEIGARAGRITAERVLRARLAIPEDPTNWYDAVTRIAVGIALPAPSPRPTGVDLRLVNELANAIDIPMLSLWTQFGVTARRFVTRINPQPFAAAIYNGIAATPQYRGPLAHSAVHMRLVLDQGWIAFGGAARLPAFVAGIGATMATAATLQAFLDPTILTPHAPALLPLGGPPSPERITLALAWFARDPANAAVNAFLSAQVLQSPNAPPQFEPFVRVEISRASYSEPEILRRLGFAPGPVSGGQPAPNLALPGSPTNTMVVTGNPYEAAVMAMPAAVYAAPSIAGPPFTTLGPGQSVRVVGTYFSWAAVDVGGRLGFMSGSDVSAPPPPPP